ncbi:hypothetical protein L218DRAFT_950861 [Marasmius fiardii PR-910]|nr:hypothetical protein L218DRAFT_950861 [Marasmius fiardii PR-910]
MDDKLSTFSHQQQQLQMPSPVLSATLRLTPKFLPSLLLLLQGLSIQSTPTPPSCIVHQVSDAKVQSAIASVPRPPQKQTFVNVLMDVTEKNAKAALQNAEEDRKANDHEKLILLHNNLMSFIHSSDFTIEGGMFNSIQRNWVTIYNQTVEGREPTMYDEVWIFNVHSDDYPHRENSQQLGEQRQLTATRTIYLTKVHGEPGTIFTAVSYSRPEAHKGQLRVLSKVFLRSIIYDPIGLARELRVDPKQGNIIDGMDGPQCMDQMRHMGPVFISSLDPAVTPMPPMAEFLQEHILWQYLCHFPLLQKLDFTVVSHLGQELGDAFNNISHQHSRSRPFQLTITSILAHSIVAIGHVMWRGALKESVNTYHNIHYDFNGSAVTTHNGWTRYRAAWLSQASRIFHELEISADQDLSDFGLSDIFGHLMQRDRPVSRSTSTLHVTLAILSLISHYKQSQPGLKNSNARKSPALVFKQPLALLQMIYH